MSYVIPPEAKCTKEILHDWALIGEDTKVISEECRFCLKKSHYNKGERGRINNTKYFNHHYRDYLQPIGSQRELYVRIYGIDAIESLRASAQHKKEHDPNKRLEQIKDNMKWEKKMANKYTSKYA